MSGIVNCSVVRRGRVVYPWKIHSITVPGISVSKYYYDVIRPEISSIPDLTSEEFRLCEAHLGKSKDKLDAIDLALPLEDDVAIFGHFLKYVVHDEDQKTREPLCSAFDLMMRVQKEVDSKALPARKPENNSKDRLYNALLTFFEDRQVKWHSSEVQQCGTALLKGLLDLL